MPFKVRDWRKGVSLPTEQGLVLGCKGKKDELTALVDSDDIHCLMIAAAGAGKGELLGTPLPPEIEPLLTRRKLYTAPASAAEREPLGSRYLLCAAPILVHGDIEGGVLLHGTLREAAPNAETVRAAATAAEFLARWMEE